MFIIYLLNHFLDYFPNDSYTESKNINSKISILTENNYWIILSIFNHLTNNGGGAISISSIPSKVVLEFIYFLNCSSTSEGGAIRSISTSSVILKGICGNDCKAVSSGQFAYINSDNINKVILTSNINCYPKTISGTSNCFYIKYPSYLNLNCSSINTNRDSFGTIFNSPGEINFTTISNCYSYDSGWGITIHHYQSSLTNYYSLNFVNNSQLGTTNGLIHVSSATTKIYESLFFANKYQLFSGSAITVYDSYMQTSYNSVNGYSLKFEISILPIFNTFYCFNITENLITPYRSYDERCKNINFSNNFIKSKCILNTILIRFIFN